MAKTETRAAKILGISTCVPAHRFDNLKDTTEFSPGEVRKVVDMAGVQARHTADESICSSDLCFGASRHLLERIGWAPESIDAVIMVTQSPDYFLPSTACLLQDRLGLPAECAAFDVGLGCSGYPYGLYLAASMLQTGGMKRILLLHGETPSRFARESDRSVSLLFGDAGTATALEASPDSGESWFFVLGTDGSGYRDLIIEGGGFRNRQPEDSESHYVHMNGANIFNFTCLRVPPLIRDTLEMAGLGSGRHRLLYLPSVEPVHHEASRR